MSINSRAKGKAGELELSKVLNVYGFDCRRGQQYSGAIGDADVVGLPHIHIECKRVEHLNIDKALSQAERDAYADTLRQGKKMYPAVFHRSNSDHKPDSTKGAWKVTMLLDDWMEIYKRSGYGKRVD